MVNIKKLASHLLAFGIFATAGLFSIAHLCNYSHPLKVEKAPSMRIDSQSAKQYTASDFAGEIEANSEEIGVSINQSNVTESSQSLTFTFRSKTLVGFATARKNYIIQIDDPNFSGDLDKPAADDYEILDEESGLPIFTGFVSFVTGASSSNSEVYLPATITKEDGFIINVTRIAKNAVTETGEQYNGKNSWSKITNIYIPDSITVVEEGAFTGFATAKEGTQIHYQGTSLPSGFASGWTDAPSSAIEISANNYKETYRHANVSGKVDDLVDELGRPVNFILGCQEGGSLSGEAYNRPLVIQYDRVIIEGGVEKSRQTIYEELPLVNTVGNPYDSCGPMSRNSYSRLLSYRLDENEEIDDDSIVFHNLMKASATSEIYTDQTYFAKAIIGYGEKQDINNLVHYRATMNSTFAGYSMFSISMDKNLSITSEKYPEPHSLYLDVKTEMYEQNKLKIEAGTTKIRYSLYNLYNSSYHIQYIGNNDELKDIVIPIKTVVSNQILESDKNNAVSVLLKNKDVAPDFDPKKVKVFELENLTIQMDLLATSDSGSVSVLGKSSISYKFAYISVVNTDSIKVFNWNFFIIIFFIAYILIYSGLAFAFYKYCKEKYKNDEFRRVNGKKFLKKAILGGLGLGEVLAALLFIIMRVTFFKSTIVVFNPTDPLLIAFSIVGIIIVGYFIVYLVKAIKTNRERKKILRLKLNEDVEDDGTI